MRNYSYVRCIFCRTHFSQKIYQLVWNIFYSEWFGKTMKNFFDSRQVGRFTWHPCISRMGSAQLKIVSAQFSKIEAQLIPDGLAPKIGMGVSFFLYSIWEVGSRTAKNTCSIIEDDWVHNCERTTVLVYPIWGTKYSAQLDRYIIGTSFGVYIHIRSPWTSSDSTSWRKLTLIRPPPVQV